MRGERLAPHRLRPPKSTRLYAFAVLAPVADAQQIAGYGAGWTQFGVLPTTFVPADAGSSETSGSSSGPQFCGCLSDVTSGVLANTSSFTLPSLGPIDSGPLPTLEQSFYYSPYMAQDAQAYDQQLILEQLGQMAPADEEMIVIGAVGPPAVVGASFCNWGCVAIGLVGVEIYNSVNPDMEGQPANVPENIGHPPGEEPEGPSHPPEPPPSSGPAPPPPPPAP